MVNRKLYALISGADIPHKQKLGVSFAPTETGNFS